VHNFIVSLDGYASGEGQSLEAPFGHAQQQFRHWFGEIKIGRGLQPDGKFGVDEAIASAWRPGIGAEIMGRNKFRPTSGPWPEDGWRGWWGANPPFQTPCFVWTHYPREPMKMEGGTTFHFVEGTPAEVLALAKKAAGDLDVRIGGGASTLNAFLKADLVDYLHIVVVPMILGRGAPVWGGLEGLQERFDVTSMTSPNGATHVFFTRRS
jgi:dihydrofolate reductase